MKKITLFSILAAFVAALSFTSCNTDSDGYSPLSKEAQKNFQIAMSVGSYNDMVVLFEKKNDANVNNQTDSVASSVGISMTSDSTMSISNFPIAAIAEHISNKDLSQAIAKVAPRTITCKYNVMPNSTSEVAYYIACPNVIELNLAYGADNKSHKVQLVFMPNQNYYGYCTLKDPRKLGFQFYLYQIWVDGALTGYIKNSINSKYSTVAFAVRNAWKKNGYSPLSKEAQKNFQMAMSVGSYNDMVVLFEKKNNANVNNQTDSVASTVGISMTGDSTMSISNFPIAAIAEHISNKDLSQAIAKVAPRTITCKYNVMPNSTSEVAYYIACPNVIELNLAYGADNKSHKVQLVFMPNQNYYGYCTLKDPRKLGFQFALYQILVDGAQTDYIKNSINSNYTVAFAVRNIWKKTGK